MWNGSVVAIFIAQAEGEPAAEREQVRAVPGKGLEGDRYFGKAQAPEQELTLIEVEALESLKRDRGIDLGLGDARRNIVTRGVSLNDLVGREFQVGQVALRGIRLCEPCAHLARKTHPDVLRGLLHRGGLRAQILNEGIIRVGDAVQVRPAAG